MPESSNHVGTVVFDLDGVVYIGPEPVAGAAESIELLRNAGWQILFATNNSSTTPEKVAEVLMTRSGVCIATSSVVTAGMSVAHYLKTADIPSAFVVGSQALKDTISAAGVVVSESAESRSVVVGLDRELTYERIDQASRMIRSGAHFVATNTDATFPTVSGVVPGAGAIVAAIAYAAAEDFVACGKPHAPMIQLLNERIVGERVVVVGDRPETDVALAKAAGWTSVLSLTGVTTSSDRIEPAFKPDIVISSMFELPGVLDV